MAMSSAAKIWWLGCVCQCVCVCVQICGVWSLLGAVLLDTISSSYTRTRRRDTNYPHINLIGPDRRHHGLCVCSMITALPVAIIYSIVGVYSWREMRVCVSVYSPYNNVGQSAVSQTQGDQITATEARCVFFYIKKNLIAMGPWGYSVPTKSQLA